MAVIQQEHHFKFKVTDSATKHTCNVLVCFLKEHGCISVMFVTDKCRPEFPAIVAQLVKRSGQEVPSSLQDMVTEITAQAS